MSIDAARDEVENIRRHLDDAGRDLDDLESELNNIELPEFEICLPGKFDCEASWNPNTMITTITVITGNR